MTFAKVFGVLLTLLALWLGYQENKLMADHHGGTPCESLTLGQEDPYWDKKIEESLPGIYKTLDYFMERRAAGKLDDPSADGVFKRVQHPVSWGCVNGSLEIFEVKGSDASSGLFAHSGKYQTTIRLSKTAFDPDADPKMSSISMKVLNVPKGKRADLLELNDDVRNRNLDTSDFIMVSSPTLSFVALPSELSVIHEWLIWGKLPGGVLWVLLNRPTLIPRLLQSLLHGQSISNPFQYAHYTIHPHKLGKVAARFAFMPCNTEDQLADAPKGKKEFIHDQVKSYLAEKDVCMKLMIQRQTNPCVDRIDDVLQEWVGPFEQVGVLRIPKGSAISEGADSVCENLSFNPFHNLEANRGIGWMAKIRGKIYANGAAKRISENAKKRKV